MVKAPEEFRDRLWLYQGVGKYETVPTIKALQPVTLSSAALALMEDHDLKRDDGTPLRSERAALPRDAGKRRLAT